MNFEELWEAYEDGDPCCSEDGNPNFDSQCTIRLSAALKRCGFSFDGFHGAWCWHHPKSDCHILRVEELASFLKGKFEATTMSKGMENIIEPADFAGKTGIIAFYNFWGAGNQGDHIDLFDGDQLRNGSLDYFERSEKVVLFELS